MQERRVLNTWKEIAAYLSRSVRTVQRWEISYGLPVHRPDEDVQSVYAYVDELEAWLSRSMSTGVAYVRPTLIVLDIRTPNALSNLKLSIEVAKFNVMTAFSSREVLSTAAKYDIDGFVIDSLVLDTNPEELGRELRRLYPGKPVVMVGDEPSEVFTANIEPGDPSKVVEWLIANFGVPRAS